jgi:hypothetical protein
MGEMAAQVRDTCPDGQGRADLLRRSADMNPTGETAYAPSRISLPGRTLLRSRPLGGTRARS